MAVMWTASPARATDSSVAFVRLRFREGEDAVASLVENFEAHLAGSASDDLEAGFVAARIEICGLRFHDVNDLFACHFPDLRLVKLLCPGTSSPSPSSLIPFLERTPLPLALVFRGCTPLSLSRR